MQYWLCRRSDLGVVPCNPEFGRERFQPLTLRCGLFFYPPSGDNPNREKALSSLILLYSFYVTKAPTGIWHFLTSFIWRWIFIAGWQAFHLSAFHHYIFYVYLWRSDTWYCIFSRYFHIHLWRYGTVFLLFFKLLPENKKPGGRARNTPARFYQQIRRKQQPKQHFFHTKQSYKRIKMLFSLHTTLAIGN